MKWFATAPSNIALIKYMGKSDPQTNQPANPSFSYTLDHLQSFVECEASPLDHDTWEPLFLPMANSEQPFELSKQGQQRFLSHLGKVREQFSSKQHFIVRSTNNFPAATGLASSASSFAALTKCAVRALCELSQQEEWDVDQQAALSRQGSGSSIRSFYAPWCVWDEHGAREVDIPYKGLYHQALIVDHGAKAVSSSEAHRRCITSTKYAKRAERATHNQIQLIDAFNQQNWHNAYQIGIKEFRDMHELFTSCDQPFNYINAQSEALIDIVEDIWQEHNDGPLITMDAGPNIHLLYREEQKEFAQHMKLKYFVNTVDVI